MQLNAQGITNSSDILELEFFLKEKEIDLLFINETFLKPNKKFKLLNYKIYREDRATHGGGVLIAIRNSIPHHQIAKLNTSTIENVSIVVKVNGRPIRFTSAYNPKNTPNFSNDLTKITDSTHQFFILGDFNARHITWNNYTNNTAGICLYNHQIQGNYYIYYPDEFTRFGQGSQPIRPSTIDIILTNSTLNMSPIETHPGFFNSDHVPIICEIYGSVTENKILVPMYKLANWNSITNWVDSKISSLEGNTILDLNIEKVLDDVTNILTEASKKVPLVEKQCWQRKLSQLCLCLIGQRKRFKRKLQRCYQTTERIRITSILNQLKTLINQNLFKDRNNSWNNFLRSLPAGKQKFWKITKAVKAPPLVIWLTVVEKYSSAIKKQIS